MFARDQTGAVDSDALSWPTKSCPAALDLAHQPETLRRARLGPDETALVRRKQISRHRDPPHDELIQVVQHVFALTLLSAPPGRDARNLELLAEEELAQGRQEAQQRVALHEAAAERIGDRDPARARGLQKPGDADHRVGAQLERIAHLRADAAHDQVDGLQALDRLQVDAVVTHGEIGALDDAEPEIARKVSVLEVVLLRGPGRQIHRERLIAARQAQEVLGKRTEEAREPAHVALREQLRKALRRHDAVLERVSRSGGRLGTVAQDPPAAVGRAREVERDEVQVQVVADRNARARTQELRIAEDQAGRQDFALQHALLAVQIDEQIVQQPRALDHGAFDRAPFGRVEQHREQVEAPRPAPIAFAIALRYECHAVLEQQALRLVLRGRRTLAAHGREGFEQSLPARPDRAVFARQFVESVRGTLIGRE